MSGVRCWSSIVARPEDRAALRMDPAATWLVSCALPGGHPGPHAADGGRGLSGRRPWLFWADNARAPQSCQVVEACPIGSFGGAPCGLFAGHPGPHRYPASAATGAAPPVATPPAATPPGIRPASAPAHEGVTMGEKKNRERKKGKHKQADVPAPAPAAPTGPAATADYRVDDQPTLVTRPAPTPPAPPVTLGPDSGRGSLIEIVSSDGSTRTVVAPVTTRPAPAGAVSSDRIVARPDLLAGHRASAAEPVTVRRVPTSEEPAPARPAAHSHAAGPGAVPFTPADYADAYPPASSAAPAPAAPTAASAPAPVPPTPAAPPASAASAAPDVEPERSVPEPAAEAPELVGRQVGEALREVAQALTKLADALDPR